MATQMAAVHLATAALSRSLQNSKNIMQQDSAAKYLERMTRTFILQSEALTRHRREKRRLAALRGTTISPAQAQLVAPLSQPTVQSSHLPTPEKELSNNGFRASATDNQHATKSAVRSKDPVGIAPEPGSDWKASLPDAWRREGIGGPKGNSNALTFGNFTRAALDERHAHSELLALVKEFLGERTVGGSCPFNLKRGTVAVPPRVNCRWAGA